VRRWHNAASLVKSIHRFPTNQCFSGWRNAEDSGNGLFVTGSRGDKCLTFLHIPPVVSQKSVENWSISSSLGRFLNCVAYLPENVVAVVEREETCVAVFQFCSKTQKLIAHRSIRIHLLNFRDGSPHSAPTSGFITWELPFENLLVFYPEMAITASRISTLSFRRITLDICNY